MYNYSFNYKGPLLFVLNTLKKGRDKMLKLLLF